MKHFSAKKSATKLSVRCKSLWRRYQTLPDPPLPPKVEELLSYVTQKWKKDFKNADIMVLPIMTRNALVLRPLIFYALDLFDNKNIRAPRWFVTLGIIMKRKPVGWEDF